MKATIIYPKGQFRSTEEERFEIKVSPPTVPETKIELLEYIYRCMNVVNGDPCELPQKLRCRSMSVGDIALLDGEFWMVAGCGFKKLDNHEPGQEYDWEFAYGH